MMMTRLSYTAYIPENEAPEHSRFGRQSYRDVLISERFWAKVDKNGPVSEHQPNLGQCWLWTGYLTKKRYGRFSVGRQRVRRDLLPHRWAYEEAFGPIPNGLTLDHLCRERACVNPAHLEPVTAAENTRRGERANRQACLHGHPYDEANTRFSSGYRYCRTCHNARSHVLPRSAIEHSDELETHRAASEGQEQPAGGDVPALRGRPDVDHLPYPRSG